MDVPLVLGDRSSNGVKGAIQEEVLSMDKCRNEFHKKEFVDIEEGLKMTIDWNRLYMEG